MNTYEQYDFANTGLSDETKNTIKEVKWNLGRYDTLEVYANQMYRFERGENIYQIGSNCDYNDTVTRTQKWPGRIALAYPTDYG